MMLVSFQASCKVGNLNSNSYEHVIVSYLTRAKLVTASVPPILLMRILGYSYLDYLQHMHACMLQGFVSTLTTLNFKLPTF